jgi:hypothetical protein
LNDYPKFGVWPTASNPAYLATYNMFANGRTFSGAQLCAYDRTAMLAGLPATSICRSIPNDGGYLPSDMDGSAPPSDLGQSTSGWISSIRPATAAYASRNLAPPRRSIRSATG